MTKEQGALDAAAEVYANVKYEGDSKYSSSSLLDLELRHHRIPAFKAGYAFARQSPEVLALVEALKKRTHHRECDDGWYSCPRSSEGCLDPQLTNSDCNCGANEAIEALAAFRKGGG